MGKHGVGLVVFLAMLTVLTFSPTGMMADHYSSVQHNEPTTATITGTDIAERVNDDEREYRPVISYEYTVDGQQYQEDNVYPGRFTRWDGSESTVREVGDSYEAGNNRQVSGETVTAYYDPKNPGNAYLRNDGLPVTFLRFLPPIYTVIAFLGGGYLFRQGLRRWRERKYITDTPTETAKSLSIGPSELKGTVVTGDRDPIQAPFSKEDCVVARYQIDKQCDEDEMDDKQTKSAGLLYTPFYVDDGTGTVLIQPDDDATFELNPDDWSTVSFDNSQGVPESVKQFVENSEDVDFLSIQDEKYKENLIRPGDSVYVFGTVTEREEIPTHGKNADRLVVTRDDGMHTPMFLISDEEETSLTDRRRWALWRLPVGAFFIVVAVTFFLLVTGPWLGLQTPRILDGVVGTLE